MNVVLPSRLIDQIHRHAEAAYPEECCGFLVSGNPAPDTPDIRRILRVEPAENRVAAEKERRFVIPPEEVRRFEESLKGTGESLVGFYHSHPDHSAIPSSFDQEHAWPWYTYLVLAVDQGRSGDLGAFELDPEERRFEPVAWSAASEEHAGEVKNG